MKRTFFSSLRSRLMVLIVITLIPALILILYSGLDQRRDARLMAEQHALGWAKNLAIAHERAVFEAITLLSQLRYRPAFHVHDQPTCSQILNDIFKTELSYTGFSVATATGDVFASAPLISKPINYFDRDWFQKLLETRSSIVGDYVIGRISGKPTMVVAYPLLDENAQVKTVLTCGLGFDWMYEFIRKFDLPKDTVVIIFDHEGKVLLSTQDPENLVGKSFGDRPVFKAVSAKKQGTVEEVGIDDILRLYGFVQMNRMKSDVFVMVGISAKEAYAPAARAMTRNLIIMAIVAVSTLIAAWIFGGMLIIRPTKALLHATQRVSSGDLSARTRLSQGADELSMIASAFDNMAESIQTRERQRKAVQDALAEEKERFKALVEHSPFGISLVGADGRYQYANSKFTDILGYTLEDAPTGREWFIKALPNETQRREVVATWLAGINERKTSELNTITFNMTCKDGTKKTIHIEAVRLDSGEDLVIYQDLTTQKKMEAQLIQSQKMEAVGVLAGGVAHDFNNLLSVILGYCELALMELPEKEPIYSQIMAIREAGNRAKGLTRQLLAFSRREIVRPRVLDLNTLVSELQKMLRRLVREDIDLLVTPNSATCPVKVDPGQMEQVIMNMVVNAQDAIEGKGLIEIQTANVDLTETYGREHGIEIEPGPYVALSITDTGCGMDEETRSRIFDPFFTTKATGKGTGLGMAVVYGIVKQNHGFIWVYSEPGHGTTIKIYLPRAQGPVEAVHEEGSPHKQVTGVETILVAEDNAQLRTLIRETLTKYGYRVLEAENGKTALALYEQHKGQIQLIITDVVMPEMDGKDMARQISTSDPNVKVLFISGYTPNAIAHYGILEEGVHFIEKPFTPGSLVQKVRSLLDEK